MAISNIRWRFASMISLMYVMSAVSGFKLQVSNKTTTESVTMDADVNENAIQKYDLKSVIDFVHPKKAKIVGGQDVVYGEYPWQAGICKIYNNVTKPWCGASILNNYWVVSAAHCFESIKAHNLRVFVGDYDTESKDVGEEEFNVEKLIIHEKYRTAYVGYDIALIKIKPKNGRGMIFSKYVQAISLPKSTTPYIEGTKCKISGWGDTSYGTKTSPSILRAAEVPLVSHRKCAEIYKCPFGNSRITVCAGYASGGVDTCQGDSGGPLVCKVEGVNLLFGITSFGIRCALPNYPGVYTRVSEFLPWIRSKIGYQI